MRAFDPANKYDNEWQASIIMATEGLQRQIAYILYDVITGFAKDAWLEASSEGSNRTIAFQLRLRDVKYWNAAQISTIVNRVLAVYPDLPKYIATAFVSIVRTYTRDIEVGSSHPTVKLKLPSTDDFVHKVFICYARWLYEDPSRWRNRDMRERDIQDAVVHAMQDMMPGEIFNTLLGGSVAADGTLTPFAQKQDDDDDDDVGDDDDDDDDAADGGDGDDGADDDASASASSPPPPPPSQPQPQPQTLRVPDPDLTATEILRSVRVDSPDGGSAAAAQTSQQFSSGGGGGGPPPPHHHHDPQGAAATAPAATGRAEFGGSSAADDW